MKAIARWVSFLFPFFIPLSLWGMQALVIVGFLATIFWWLGGDRQIALKGPDWAVAGFLCAVALSWLPAIGFSLDPLRMSGIWPVAAYVMFRGPGGEVVESPRWRMLWAAAAAAVGIYAVAQYYYGLDWARLGGPDVLYPAPAAALRFAVIGFFDRHHSFAVMAAMSLVFLFASAPPNESRRRRCIYHAAMLPLLAALFLAQSRAAWLAAALVLLWPVAAGQRRRHALALLGAVGAAAVLMALLEPGVAARFGGFFGHRGETDRWAIFKVAAVLGDQWPLVGFGFGRFFIQAGEVFSQLASLVEIRSGTHNEWLAAQVEGGLLLGLAQLWLVVSLFRAGVRGPCSNRPRIQIGALMAIMVFIIASMAHNVFVDGELAFPFWMLAGVLARSPGNGEKIFAYKME